MTNSTTSTCSTCPLSSPQPSLQLHSPSTTPPLPTPPSASLASNSYIILSPARSREIEPSLEWTAGEERVLSDRTAWTKGRTCLVLERTVLSSAGGPCTFRQESIDTRKVMFKWGPQRGNFVDVSKIFPPCLF